MSARLLVVAGHDPTHGAGVDADRAAAEHFGAEACCIVTAWTDQDGARVRAVGARPTRDWLFEALTELRSGAGRPFAALKSGLLPDAAGVRALALLLDELRPGPAVVDPVLAASGGETFLDEEGIAALLHELLPRGVILTPNLPEAARLTGLELESLQHDPDTRVAAAEALLARGAAAVLLKGGHGRETDVQDLVLERGGPPFWVIHERSTGRLHGSGCRYASAVAAQLARGIPLQEAARAASAWLAELFAAAPPPRLR